MRYEIYIGEMGRTQRHADHARKLVREPLDDTPTGSVLGAFQGERAVGTVRLNLASTGALAEYAELYNLATFGRYFPQHLSITTKLMVSPEFRRSDVAFRLFTTLFEIALRAGSLFNVIDCNTPVKPIFERLGFRQFMPDVEHSEYGTVSPMALVLRDLHHLRCTRSPFAELCGAHHSESADFFARMILARPDTVPTDPHEDTGLRLLREPSSI